MAKRKAKQAAPLAMLLRDSTYGSRCYGAVIVADLDVIRRCESYSMLHEDKMHYESLLPKMQPDAVIAVKIILENIEARIAALEKARISCG